MLRYDELLSTDPAWPELAAMLAKAAGRVTVLPAEPTAARACLEALQVTTRSPLGAIAHETGGLLVDHAWLRVLGSGHPQLARTLGGWNARLGVAMSQMVIVADDIIGGVFAVNGGGLGPELNHVFYFAPDTLAWSDLGCGYGDWLGWVCEGEIETFYEDSRWPGWEAEAEACGGDRALSLYPFPWTAEGRDLARVARRPVRAEEIWALQLSTVAKLSSP